MAVRPEEIHGTCLALSLSTLAAALTRWGIDVATVLATADLSPADLEEPERRISLRQYHRVWDSARDATQDEALGLHVLEAFDVKRILSPFVYIAWSSATPREAFEHVVPYLRLAHEGLEIDLREEHGQSISEIRFRGRENDRTASEYFVGLMVKVAPVVVGRDGSLTAWFRHAAPSYAAEYESILGTRVRFGAPFDAIVGSAADLDRPLPKADAILCSILGRQAADALSQLPATSGFSEEVTREIERRLRKGQVDIEAVAKGLGLSARTLRRRLRESELGYRDLLDRVRCDLARRALSKPDASIAEVAYSLGFSDSSAFHKAFRRWTGERPSDVVPGPPVTGKRRPSAD